MAEEKTYAEIVKEVEVYLRGFERSEDLAQTVRERLEEVQIIYGRFVGFTGRLQGMLDEVEDTQKSYVVRPHDLDYREEVVAFLCEHNQPFSTKPMGCIGVNYGGRKLLESDREMWKQIYVVNDINALLANEQERSRFDEYFRKRHGLKRRDSAQI